MEPINEREARQYFDDIYLAILGSNIKNGHTQDPEELLKIAHRQWQALIKHMKELRVDEI